MTSSTIDLSDHYIIYNDGVTKMYKKSDRFETYYYLEGKKETMKGLINREVREYSSGGYGTYFKENDDGSYTGHRFNSCD